MFGKSSSNARISDDALPVECSCQVVSTGTRFRLPYLLRSPCLEHPSCPNHQSNKRLSIPPTFLFLDKGIHGRLSMLQLQRSVQLHNSRLHKKSSKREPLASMTHLSTLPVDLYIRNNLNSISMLCSCLLLQVVSVHGYNNARNESLFHKLAHPKRSDLQESHHQQGFRYPAIGDSKSLG